MGVISMTPMLKYGYSTRHTMGVIAASGTITQLIPPSLVLVVLADQMGRSVGDMYAGAIGPNLNLRGNVVRSRGLVSQAHRLAGFLQSTEVDIEPSDFCLHAREVSPFACILQASCVLLKVGQRELRIPKPFLNDGQVPPPSNGHRHPEVLTHLVCLTEQGKSPFTVSAHPFDEG